MYSMRLGANVSFLICLDREEQNTPSRPEIRDTDSVYGDPGTDVEEDLVSQLEVAQPGEMFYNCFYQEDQQYIFTERQAFLI